MVGDEAVRFKLERPPVTRVVLTLAFEAAPSIQNWQLAGFFTGLRDRYLSVSEAAPVPTDKGDGSFEFLGDDDPWPIPRTEFVSPGRSLGIQGDQMDVVWDFGMASGERDYVGFESLIGEMADVYEQFANELAKNHVRLEPRTAQCHYTNEILGLEVTELAVGVLTDWAPVQSRPTDAPGYVGVRIHACKSPEHSCSSWVMVDSQEDGSPTLSIRVRRPIAEGDIDPMAAMREAHDELIGLFKRHTSDELRQAWGEQ
ncbi:MAG: hypothetical protein HY829_15360 [Actinobacteria bacterium]|nr:hypothetical protein [Actinomycetota bacterium]